MKKGAIYGKFLNEDKIPYVQHLLDKLEAAGTRLVIYKPFLELLKNRLNFKSDVIAFESHQELDDKTDFLISIGGDGTLLGTIALIRNSGIPVAGFNIGRLGFLSSIAKEDIERAVDEIIKGKYAIDKRTLLKLETNKNLPDEMTYSLNEITIHKKDSSSMITINAYVNDEYLNCYRADGLIVATPTGSTAYSMSCGGPIITPDSGNFIITPVAPHNLTVRPIVIPDTNTIKLNVSDPSENFLVSLDSRSEVMDSSIKMIIKKADFHINLIRLKNQSFLSTLRNKLMWGMDMRK